MQCRNALFNICDLIHLHCKTVTSSNYIYFLLIFIQSAALYVISEQHRLVSVMFGQLFCLRRRIFRSPVTADLPLTSAPLSSTYIPCTKAKIINPATSSPSTVLFTSLPAYLTLLDIETHLLPVFFMVPLHPVIFISFCFSHCM